jgi:hypothetical protein
MPREAQEEFRRHKHTHPDVEVQSDPCHHGHGKVKSSPPIFDETWKIQQQHEKLEAKHHSHTHASTQVTSSTVSHSHNEVQSSRNICGSPNLTISHFHTEWDNQADLHSHTFTVSFASANLGSPWYNHVHALSATCSSAGTNHTHTGQGQDDGGSCSYKPACGANPHTHPDTYSLANGGSAHSDHTVSGNSDYANSGQTQQSHSHTFSFTSSLGGGHSHNFAGSCTIEPCYFGANHAHNYSGITNVATHQHTGSGTSGLGGESGATTVTVSDALSLSDHVLTNKTLKLSDSLGVADSMKGNKNPLIINDMLAIVDALLTNKKLKAADALAITDSIKANKTLIVNDVLSIADELLANKTLKMADALAIADAIILGKILSLQDQLAISDSTRANKTLNIQDALNISDAIQLSQALKKVSDTLSLTDNVNVIGGILQQIIDSLSISDSIITNKNLNISDALSISDNIILSIIHAPSEQAEAGDEGFPAFRRRLIELSGSISGTVKQATFETLPLHGSAMGRSVYRSNLQGEAKTNVSRPISFAGACLSPSTANFEASGRTVQKAERTFEAGGQLLCEVKDTASQKGSCLNRESSTIRLKGRNMALVLIADEDESDQPTQQEGAGEKLRNPNFKARTMEKWTYTTVDDDRTCVECDAHDMQEFNVGNVDELQSLFPYGEVEAYNTFRPMIHPNCRCVITLVETYYEED